MACDAIGVLSMLTSMSGSRSGDPELRRVVRDGERGFLSFICFSPSPVLVILYFEKGEKGSGNH